MAYLEPMDVRNASLKRKRPMDRGISIQTTAPAYFSYDASPRKWPVWARATFIVGASVSLWALIIWGALSLISAL